MTLGEAIERLDALKPNAYTPEQKADWINKLEGIVQIEIKRTIPIFYDEERPYAVTISEGAFFGGTDSSELYLPNTAVFGFSQGDVVTISGCIAQPANNVTANIRWVEIFQFPIPETFITFEPGVFAEGPFNEQGFTLTRTKSATRLIPVQYVWPWEEGVELMVGPPYDDIYVLYLAAQVDFWNNDMGLYANSKAIFNASFDECAKYYNRWDTPAQKQRVQRVRNLWG